ncbi:MAG: bifunctional molybdenum cofactor biosynthesis protein MoaC/MoaB [Planctomycetota bacterium]
MKDVSEKFETLRTARAQAIIRCNSLTIEKIKKGELKKGDALSLARVAGVLAAKRTFEIIPYCHPIRIDCVEIDFEFNNSEIKIVSTIKAIDRTGVEMEALTAATLAALTIYDMVKPEDYNVEITDIKLLEKSGGKSDYLEEFKPPLKAAVVVLSDSVFTKRKEDKAGLKVKEALEKWKVEVTDYTILPDEPQKLKEKLQALLENNINMVLTVGGTGLGVRDKTVETIKPMLEVEIPGITEASRSYGQRRTPYAMLSRGIAGLIKNTLIITLPGSSKGAKESMDAIFPGVLHIFSVLRKDPHRSGYS